MKKNNINLTICFLVGSGIVTSSVQASYSDVINEKESIISLVNTYFSIRYRAILENAPYDFSSIIDFQHEPSKDWFTLENSHREIERFIFNLFGLTVIDFSFDLEIVQIEIEENKAKIILIENNSITYNISTTKSSKMRNLKHIILLQKSSGKWMLVQDNYLDDNHDLMGSLPVEVIFNNILSNFDEYLFEKNLNVEELSSTTFSSGLPIFYYDNFKSNQYASNNYFREGPVPSPIINHPGWDPSWDDVYKRYEDDCTNFISQAVFEGVQYISSDLNYFYPNPANDGYWWYYKFSDTANGSTPWISVGDFYNFLVNNFIEKVRGPAGIPITLEEIQYGDLIMMKDHEGGNWQHAVIVDTVYYPPLATNIFVTAHSRDVYHEPLINFSGYVWYPMHILGYYNYVTLPVVFKSILTSFKSGSQLFEPYIFPDNQFDFPYPPP